MLQWMDEYIGIAHCFVFSRCFESRLFGGVILLAFAKIGNEFFSGLRLVPFDSYFVLFRLLNIFHVQKHIQDIFASILTLSIDCLGSASYAWTISSVHVLKSVHNVCSDSAVQSLDKLYTKEDNI